MRNRAVLVVVSLALAGCSGEEQAASTTVPLPGPRAVVSDLVKALEREDWEATRSLVDDGQLALLAAVESEDVSEAEEMVEAGPPPGVRAAFWSSFIESLNTFSGRELAKGEIGDPERFRVGSVRFSAVPFRFGRRISHDWVLRQGPDGWKVDLLATFGARFATPLHDWLVAVEGAPEVAKIRQALRARPGQPRGSRRPWCQREQPAARERGGAAPVGLPGEVLGRRRRTADGSSVRRLEGARTQAGPLIPAFRSDPPGRGRSSGR